VPGLIPSETVTNLLKTLKKNLMLSVCHGPEAETSFLKRLLGAGSWRSVALGKAPCPESRDPAPGLRPFGLCRGDDGMNRAMGLVMPWDTSCARSSRGFCRKLMPAVLAGPSRGPPSQAEAGAVSPAIPTARQPGLRSGAMPERPAGSQPCCPAAPSSLRSPRTSGGICHQRETLLLHRPAAAARCGRRGSPRLPTREQAGTQGLRPAAAETCCPAGVGGPCRSVGCCSKAGGRGEQSDARRVAAEWLLGSQASGFCYFLDRLTVSSLY